MWPFKRRGLRWQRSGSTWTVCADRGRLGTGATVGPNGVTCRPFLRKRQYSWRDIAAISIDCGKAGPFLCLCIYGDPYPKPMDAGSHFGDEIRALLPPIKDFVEAMGAEIIVSSDCATFWWHLDPRARRDFVHANAATSHANNVNQEVGNRAP